MEGNNTTTVDAIYHAMQRSVATKHCDVIGQRLIKI